MGIVNILKRRDTIKSASINQVIISQIIFKRRILKIISLRILSEVRGGHAESTYIAHPLVDGCDIYSEKLARVLYRIVFGMVGLNLWNGWLEGPSLLSNAAPRRENLNGRVQIIFRDDCTTWVRRKWDLSYNSTQ